MRQVIREECDVFSGDGDGIGDIRSHPMKINLKDDHPVQLNYNSVPRHLHNDLKTYIEDLLNRQWIVNFSSPYSSPVVAVRKKDGTMMLCCDYRKLNATQYQTDIHSRVLKISLMGLEVITNSPIPQI